MRSFAMSVLIMFACTTQILGFEVVIDGILDESIYTVVEPLKSEISSLYLVPMVNALYIGMEVEDDSINVANPEEFWNASCVEVWFDWDNNDSPTFDIDDQQFWFCPVNGKGDQGYVGQWHRAADNIPATMFDYAHESDLIDMAFVTDGEGYTIEARIGKDIMDGYKPTGTIGFTYSADKGAVKFEWEEAMLGGSFFEKPDQWPDLVITEVLAVQAEGKLATLWGTVKTEE